MVFLADASQLKSHFLNIISKALMVFINFLKWKFNKLTVKNLQYL